MTEQKLRALVAQAVRLDRGIHQAQEKLKGFKAQIAAEAETRADEAVATEGGGTSITFEGIGGCIARVTTAGPTLKSAVKPTDKKFDKIKEAACGFFTRLFETEVVYKPVAEFRDRATELLGRGAGTLIKLCETPGKTMVSFETKNTEERETS